MVVVVEVTIVGVELTYSTFALRTSPSLMITGMTAQIRLVTPRYAHCRAVMGVAVGG